MYIINLNLGKGKQVKEQITTLSKLKKGQEAIILEINIENIIRKKHLLEMGLTKGTKIKVKKVAPLGSPIAIEFRDYELCLSKKEIENIMVVEKEWEKRYV